jgi:hypothetical protein
MPTPTQLGSGSCCTNPPRWPDRSVGEGARPSTGRLGDHDGFLLEPLEASSTELPSELSFQEAKDIKPGHEP